MYITLNDLIACCRRSDYTTAGHSTVGYLAEDMCSLKPAMPKMAVSCFVDTFLANDCSQHSKSRSEYYQLRVFNVN